ncbi:MAG TPA: SMEK domain-containing protein [Bacteroidales bacterium]|nr:SMEK domain-containing protein [Bacteroidales bacterium]
MNGQIYLWEITRYLAWSTSQVRIENKNGNFDINKYAEGFLIPILNEIYKKSFERLEFIKQNYPAMDLGSKDHQ